MDVGFVEVGVGVVEDVGKFGFVSVQGRVFGSKNLGLKSFGGV